MMNKKTIGIILVIVGAVGQIFSLSADFLGIGNDPATVGWKQLLGAGVGLIVILVGVYFLSTVKSMFLPADQPEDIEEEEQEALM
jgi:NADH:ubiquinone oxidoreductase subunit 6 (subunit J)